MICIRHVKKCHTKEKLLSYKQFHELLLRCISQRHIRKCLIIVPKQNTLRIQRFQGKMYIRADDVVYLCFYGIFLPIDTHKHVYRYVSKCLFVICEKERYRVKINSLCMSTCPSVFISEVRFFFFLSWRSPVFCFGYEDMRTV